ncbi:MAG TPA: carboxypeptidase-like regulatory domain-containing protein, partial [Bryobacteraceae bacterium]
MISTTRRPAGRYPRISKTIFSSLIACCALLLPLLVTPALRAQENATINGLVTDASGAVVANASLTLTNTATGVERKETSNSVGAYRFGNVGIGTYTLTAIAPGFQTFTTTGIVVNVAQTLEENVAFKVGAATQTVSVQANALQTQTETSEVSTLISSQQVEQLSTNGRNVTQLAALGLGVSNTLPSFGGVDALTSANTISFNGTRTTHNIYLLDGAEQNDRGCGGCFMNLPAQDAIAEFQTLDSNYSPDYGIGSGGTIVMALKSGTRNFHGELYEFNRNTDYNANDYFVKRSGKPRPVFQLNEPGGNIGGPLFIPGLYNNNRNRTFFFWNEEWRRLILGSSPLVANTIPTADFPTAAAPLTYTSWNNPAVAGGNSSCNPGVQAPCVPKTTDPVKLALYTADGLTAGNNFPGNVIPANLIDQNAVLRSMPAPSPSPTLAPRSTQPPSP